MALGSRMVNLLSRSVPYLTNGTTGTIRHPFEGYPNCHGPWFTDRKLTFTIRNPILPTVQLVPFDIILKGTPTAMALGSRMVNLLSRSVPYLTNGTTGTIRHPFEGYPNCHGPWFTDGKLTFTIRNHILPTVPLVPFDIILKGTPTAMALGSRMVNLLNDP